MHPLVHRIVSLFQAFTSTEHSYWKTVRLSWPTCRNTITYGNGLLTSNGSPSQYYPSLMNRNYTERTIIASFCRSWPTSWLSTNTSKAHNNRLRVCTYHCAQLTYTTQHRTVLIIFPLILRTMITAQMLSTGGQQDHTGINNNEWHDPSTNRQGPGRWFVAAVLCYPCPHIPSTASSRGDVCRNSSGKSTASQTVPCLLSPTQHMHMHKLQRQNYINNDNRTYKNKK